MSAKHTDSLAVVTGACGGIGQAICRRLASAGRSCIVLVDQSTEGLAATAVQLRRQWPELDVRVYMVDLADMQAVDALAQHLCEAESLDLLFNNAGILHKGAVDNIGFMEQLDASTAVNLAAAFRLTMGLLPKLRERASAVVNTASVCSERALVGEGAYCIAKAGLAQLTRCLAVELAEFGVRVNAVAPGLVRTPMTSTTINDDVRLNTFLRRVPLRRPAEPDEIAAACVFLGSADASYITGAILPVDGGYLCS